MKLKKVNYITNFFDFIKSTDTAKGMILDDEDFYFMMMRFWSS